MNLLGPIQCHSNTGDCLITDVLKYAVVFELNREIMSSKISAQGFSFGELIYPPRYPQPVPSTMPGTQSSSNLVNGGHREACPRVLLAVSPAGGKKGEKFPSAGSMFLYELWTKTIATTITIILATVIIKT